jgi:hypothetical protein
MKQTAVEWLHYKITNPTSHELLENINLWFLKAKEMEKDQMINSYLAGKWDEKFTERKSEEFYEQTYEKK